MTILSNREVILRTSSTTISRPLMSSSAATVIFTNLSSLIKQLAIQTVAANIIENGFRQQIARARSALQRGAHERRRDIEAGHRNGGNSARWRQMHCKRLLHVTYRVLMC